jgi:tetratricopeptide (TPR) repeat protein
MSKKTQGKEAPFSLPREPIAATVPLPQQAGMSIEHALAAAAQHQEAGRLQQAEHILRQVLQAQPRQPFALHLLGIVAHMAGNSDMAVKLISEAISIDDRIPLFHANKGEICRRMGRLEDAVTHGRKAVSLDPGFVSGHSNLGIAYFDQGDNDKAEQCHIQALKLDPKFGPSLNNMGSILRKRRDYEGAVKYFNAAIEANPASLDPQNNLGEVYLKLDRSEESFKILDRVLAVNPRHASAHCNRGMAFLTIGDETQAQACFMRSLGLDPKCFSAYYGLALALLELDKTHEAENCARKLLEHEPNNADYSSLLGSILFAREATEESEAAFHKALGMDKKCLPAMAGLGHVLMEKGDLEGAEKLFRECMVDKTEASSALYSLIQVRKMKPDDPEIKMLEAEAKKLEGKIADSKAIPLNFALGKMYDDIGDYERGFPYYIDGCRLKRKKFNYSLQEREEGVKRIKQVFTPEFMAKNAGQGDPSALPIFVLGMPRSGTTLTEQIIASHPSVFGAGELRDMRMVLEPGFAEGTGLPFYERLQDLKPGALAALAQSYVSGLRKRNADAEKITDKMPGNFHYIPLIKLMMPNAKIVHVSRHPLDTCISCFTRLFAHGQAYTYDLTDLGHYYKTYEELMDHWRKLLPAGSFYDVKYENLVEDTEAEAKKLIEYCGLEWNDSCLEFYKNKRSVRTSSVTQVRQPIYKTSKQRWKNYDKFLGPLKEALGDVLDKYDR